MAKTRSPRYPTIGLKEAIDKTRLVWGKDYQTPTQRGVIAGHMGYNSLNGKSLGVLSAVGKYGLLEGRGSEYRVSDLAVRILAQQPGDPDRVAAIREAATLPDLFQELDKRFPNGKVSDQSIRSYLIMQKFIPAAADAAIRSYRETKQLVETETKGYESPDLEPDEAVKHDRERKGDSERREPPADPPERRSHQLSRRPPVTAGRKQDVFSLPEGEIVLEWPEPLSPESYEDFESWLKLVLRKVKRSVREPGKDQTTPPPAPESAQAEQPMPGVSLMITQDQRTTLRERGYDDEQIREMKPEDAHRVLGIVN